MQIFGLAITRATKATGPVRGSSLGGFIGTIREGFAGAWQKNVEIESRENLLAFSAVYSCISRIADDISKLRIKLVEQDKNGIWLEVPRRVKNPYIAVLRKPNQYQTRIQFISSWITSKLMHGNTYVLKEYDTSTGFVRALHILDPRLVTVLVGPEGDVYYRLSRDDLAQVPEDMPTIPAKWIIHDRMVTLWHPLLGVSPIYACAVSATQGIRIQNNSAKFFENMSRPSGHLTAPEALNDKLVNRLKEAFEQNFSGGNIGRLLVTGSGVKYEAMTIPAHEAQLIEQLRWTIEDVARCFHVPLHKISSNTNPTFNNIGALNQDYYAQTLQPLMEAMELLMDEGLGLPTESKEYGVELDLDGLLRMDPGGRADVAAKRVQAGVMSPDEARFTENLPPVPGGGTPYLQHQNYSLAALAKRDAKEDPFATSSPPPALPPPTPPPEEDDTAEKLLIAITKRFDEAPCLV
jgi:HK97 family phage portal protein